MTRGFASLVILLLSGSAALAAPTPPAAPDHRAQTAAKPAPGAAKDALVLDADHFLRDAAAAAQRGDTLAAIQLYQSAIIFAPSEPDAYDQLAQFYVMTSQPDMAQKYFSIALDVEPANPAALKGLALLDLAAGNRAGAMAQHDILVRSCGKTCPEAAQVEQALGAGAAGARN